MKALLVKQSGTVTKTIHLQDGREYVFGRSETCDIKLDDEKSISRQHFKLLQVEGAWKVQVLSRFGFVIYKGQRESQIELASIDSFSIPPFDFELVEINEAQVQNPVESATDSTSENSNSNMPAVYQAPGLPAASEESHDDFEATYVGAVEYLPYIKIIDSTGEAKALYKLEGDSWVAGRESHCPIHINDPRVSRRQYEIRRMGQGFYIIDLGSVNGTLLNGDLISSLEPTPLKSGDAISVLDNHMYFELRDPAFDAKVKILATNIDRSLMPMSNPVGGGPLQPLGGNIFNESYGVPAPYGNPDASNDPYSHSATPAAESFQPIDSSAEAADKKKKFIRILIAVLILVGAYFLSEEDSSKKSTTANPAPNSTLSPAEQAFAKLKPEDQSVVNQAYELALNLFKQQKFELARQKLATVYNYLPEYKDSKEIDALITQAIQNIAELERQRSIEQAKEEQEAKIKVQVEECRKIVNPKIETAQLDDCLSPVIAFNPDHPDIAALKSEVEAIVTQRMAAEQAQKEVNDKASKLRAIYNAAESEAEKSGPLKAIKAYERVIKSDLPDPAGLKGISARKIESIKAGIKKRVDTALAKGNQALAQSQFKAAVIAFKDCLEIDPFSIEAKAKYDKALNELRKTMMTPYQEAVLEESVGEVEAAKVRWKKIRDQSLPEEEYYQKATIKLKKYGAL
jgi:pSer/pThr/pTyr-binding forkhead associated (FHA) protein/tetratricopeptide (TPR) repeat protein